MAISAPIRIRKVPQPKVRIRVLPKIIPADGEPGATATVEIGTVTTLPAGSDATVENVGTENAAVLDFGIPQGAAGDPGADGVIQSIVAGSNITVDATDPANPIVSATGGGGGAVDSVNGQTGVVVLDADDIDDTSTTNKFATAAQLSNADSAVQPTDTDASGFGFVIDEDDMASDSATKVPTQQSVKAYVDTTPAADGSITDAKIASPSKVRNRFEQQWLIQDFGGGTGVSDSANVLALEDALDSERKVIFPHDAWSPYNLGDGEFVIEEGVEIIGESHTQIRSAADDALFLMRGQARKSVIKDLLIDMADASTVTSAAIRMDNYDPTFDSGNGAGRTLYEQIVEDCWFVNCYRAIADSDHNGTKDDDFTGTGSQTDFPLSWAPASTFYLTVYVDGVLQVHTTDYTFSGTTLTFVVAPANGATIRAFNPRDYRGYLFDAKFKGIRTYRARGSQIILRRTQGMILLKDIFISPAQAPGYASAIPDITWPGIDIANFVGIELRRVDVVGQGFADAAGYVATQDGIRLTGVDETMPESGIEGNRHVWMERVYTEAMEGDGVILANIDFLDATLSGGSGCRGFGWYLENVRNAGLSQMRIRGGTGLTGAVANTPALTLVGCSDLNISNSELVTATGMGLRAINSTNVNASNIIMENNAGSIEETGTSDYNTYTNIIAHDNTSNTPILVGKNSRVKGGVQGTTRQPDSGSVFRANKGGTAQTGVLSATFTKVSFANEEFDYGGHYNTSTQRWVPPAGPVHIEASATVTAGIVDGTESTILIYKNGASVAQRTYRPGAANVVTLAIETTQVADGDDYFEVYVYIAGAGDKTIGGTAAQSSFAGRLL